MDIQWKVSRQIALLVVKSKPQNRDKSLCGRPPTSSISKLFGAKGNLTWPDAVTFNQLILRDASDDPDTPLWKAINQMGKHCPHTVTLLELPDNKDPIVFMKQGVVPRDFGLFVLEYNTSTNSVLDALYVHCDVLKKKPEAKSFTILKKWRKEKLPHIEYSFFKVVPRHHQSKIKSRVRGKGILM